MRDGLILILLCFLTGFLLADDYLNFQNLEKAKSCLVLAQKQGKVALEAKFGSPDSIQGSCKLIGAPEPLSKADTVYIYKFGKVHVSLGFKHETCLGGHISNFHRSD